MQRWREQIWAAVPPDVAPEQFDERLELLLAELTAGQRVLDLGCGDGSFSAPLAAAGAEVVGVDVADEALRRARLRAPQLQFVGAAEDGPLPFADDCFDLVWCGETLEHVVDVGLLLGEARRLLVPGGLLLITTPNQPRLLVAAEALAGRPLERRLDPRADHLRFFTARTLALAVTGAGFENCLVNSFGGLPLARRSLVARAR